MLFDTGCVVCACRVGPVCADCAAGLQPAGPTQIEGLDACRVGFALDATARTVIAAFKYQRQRKLARWLASSIDGLMPRGADLITWVPATPKRRRSRGFDQAEELARALAARAGVPARGLLLRGGSDERQTGQSRAARLAGPALHACGSSPEFVAIVDDVVTTGSSMRVAANTLRIAGAQRVVGVAIAATPLSGDRCLPASQKGCSVHKWT